MYVLCDPPESSTQLGCWARPLGRFSEVVGYTHLGSFFLRDPTTANYLVLYPLVHGANAKNYGPFPSSDAFESAVLKDPYFVEKVLRPGDLKILEQSLGRLNAEQVYFPVPYPFLGGSGELSTYDKGNVWVFADLVGQASGIG